MQLWKGMWKLSSGGGGGEEVGEDGLKHDYRL